MLGTMTSAARATLLSLSLLCADAALLQPMALRTAMTAAAAAAMIATSPAALAQEFAVDESKISETALAACPVKELSVCRARATQAVANAKNEARLARVALCDQEKQEVVNNNGEVPSNIKPATSGDKIPATCVGYPTYQLKPGDSSLPRIY